MDGSTKKEEGNTLVRTSEGTTAGFHPRQSGLEWAGPLPKPTQVAALVLPPTTPPLQIARTARLEFTLFLPFAFVSSHLTSRAGFS